MSRPPIFVLLAIVACGGTAESATVTRAVAPGPSVRDETPPQAPALAGETAEDADDATEPVSLEAPLAPSPPVTATVTVVATVSPPPAPGSASWHARFLGIDRAGGRAAFLFSLDKEGRRLDLLPAGNEGRTTQRLEVIELATGRRIDSHTRTTTSFRATPFVRPRAREVAMLASLAVDLGAHVEAQIFAGPHTAVVIEESPRRAFRHDETGARVGPLAPGLTLFRPVAALAPDDQHVALVCASGRTRAGCIALAPMDGTAATETEGLGDIASAPAWTDARTVWVASHDHGRGQLCVSRITLDGDHDRVHCRAVSGRQLHNQLLSDPAGRSVILDTPIDLDSHDLVLLDATGALVSVGTGVGRGARFNLGEGRVLLEPYDARRQIVDLRRHRVAELTGIDDVRDLHFVVDGGVGRIFGVRPLPTGDLEIVRIEALR